MVQKEFEEGMLVILYSGNMGGTLHRITEITKGGNIRVNNLLFNKNGRLRGGFPWESVCIQEASEEDVVRINNNIVKKNLYKSIQLYLKMMSKQDIETLEKLEFFLKHEFK